MSNILEIGNREYILKLDDRVGESVFAVQGDSKSRRIEIQVLNSNGQKTNVTNLKIRLFVENRGDIVYSEGNVIDGENGLMQVVIPVEGLKYPGIAKGQFQILSENEAKISSKVFEIEIGESIEYGGTLGQDLIFNFDKLIEAITKAESLEEKYNTALAEQAEIKTDIDNKHTEVVNIHTQLSGVLDKENERVEAENQRKLNETTRNEAENHRVVEENKRIQSENERVDAENQRIQNNFVVEGWIANPEQFKGEKGQDGTVSFDELTEEQKASLKGEKGKDGKDGTVAFEQLTEEQKQSLKGEKGDKGDKGEPGENGKDGKDANLTFTDNGKTYNWNLSVVDSKLRFNYEEVE